MVDRNRFTSLKSCLFVDSVDRELQSQLHHGSVTTEAQGSGGPSGQGQGLFYCGSCVTRSQIGQPKRADCSSCRAGNESLDRVVKCGRCSWTGAIRALGWHEEACPKRPVLCPGVGCGYQNVQETVQEHRKECGYIKVSCPYDCDEVFLRRERKNHFYVCPNFKVACDYAYAGCQLRLRRKDLPVHLKESMPTHLSLVSRVQHEQSKMIKHMEVQLKTALNEIASLKTQQHGFVATRSDLEKEVAGLKKREQDLSHATTAIKMTVKDLTERQNELSDLRETAADLKRKVETTEAACNTMKTRVLSVVPFTVIIKDFIEQHVTVNKPYCSPPFYSQLGGYRLQLIVRPNDDGHVALHLKLLRGEFDSNLETPFTAVATVHVKSREGGTPLCKMFPFDRAPDEYRKPTEEGTTGGWGTANPRVLAHKDLDKYTINGSLCIEITKVDFSNVTEWLPL